MKEKVKIGIIICDRYKSCAGGKCFRAIKERAGAFDIYKDKDVEISIEDKGIGIPFEEMQYLYDPFHRCSNALNYKGTGLGMMIVKRSVDTINGRINIESELNKGTKFSVIFPKR